MSKNFAIKSDLGLKYDIVAYNILIIQLRHSQQHVDFNPSRQSANLRVYRVPSVRSEHRSVHLSPTGNLGALQHTVGSPRFIQMALHLTSEKRY